MKKSQKMLNYKIQEGSPNGMALVSKTSGSNPLQVQVLYPPHMNKKEQLEKNASEVV